MFNYYNLKGLKVYNSKVIYIIIVIYRIAKMCSKIVIIYKRDHLNDCGNL